LVQYCFYSDEKISIDWRSILMYFNWVNITTISPTIDEILSRDKTN